MIEQYKIQANPLKNLEVKEVLDFVEIPTLYVETDSIGTLYLSYLDKFLDEHLEQRLVIQISNQRLKDIKSGKISVGEAFQHPESELIFLTHVSELDGLIKGIYLLPNEVFQENLNTVSLDYFLFLDGELDEGEEEISASQLEQLIRKHLQSILLLYPSQNIILHPSPSNVFPSRITYRTSKSMEFSSLRVKERA
jgi:hypothetical protein